MLLWVHTVCLLLAGGAAPVDTRFVQVAPLLPKSPEGMILRSPARARAVLLIEGLHLHVLSKEQPGRPDLRGWQQPGSALVRALARDADVFAFTYGQSAPVTDIADLPALGVNVKRLRDAGYKEIVLVGFSAGGLVARQFVEDFPSAGVARVIQVCAPNVGSPLAKMGIGGSVQKPFMQSLTARSRVQFLEDRRDKRVPPEVDFVCVVGTGFFYSDGLVSTHSQWPDDLQSQGVPAFLISAEHWQAVRGERAAQLIARLVRERQPRWDAAQIAAMRKRLWGDKATMP
jgi:hypothetical protein